jgi:adenosylcobinamide-phosphate synthase
MDAVVGEPPAAVHPVVWMGRALDALERRAPRSERRRLFFGLGVATGLPAAWAGLGWLLERWAPWPVQALALKATFSGRSLFDAARRVEGALEADQLARARHELVWLVSRPTADLDRCLVASAAIESLAENFVDSWLAPLLAYRVMGLGGACGYRAANTADAMWGYRTPQYDYLGKAAACLDDVLNWLPARIAALLLIVSGSHPSQAFAIWQRDAHLTSSPNAGQTMAAIAGQLNVRLQKPDHYILLDEGRLPEASDIAAARRLVLRATVLASCLIVASRGVRLGDLQRSPSSARTSSR